MVKSGNLNFETLTENISLNGLFIQTVCPIPIGRMAAISLNLPSASTSSTVTLDGEVVRSDDRGLALQFKSLNHDTFSLLRTVLGGRPHYV
jgi:PilZ domain